MRTTLLNPKALQMLVGYAVMLEQDAYVLCAGCYGGGDIVEMAKYRPDLRFIAIDSFAGLAKPQAEDGHKTSEGSFAYSLTQFYENTRGINIKVYPMWITPENIQRLPLPKVSMMWLDLDHYAPTRTMLDSCLDLCKPGATILTHDYTNTNYPGVKLACDEFGVWKDQGRHIAKLEERK